MARSDNPPLLSHYRTLRELGRGGMGVVYEAWDTRLERRVAVKVLHPWLFGPAGARERVLREARLAARVSHGNVVRIYRVEELEQGLAIEMEYVDGCSLAEVLQQGPMAPWQAAQLLRQVLEGLAACHAQGVIDCDLKPGNLLVTPEGRVCLTDFGISHSLVVSGRLPQETPENGQETGPSYRAQPWGTPLYAPPEAWQHEAPTEQWDLYCAGVVVLEALTGRPVFGGSSREELLEAKLDSARFAAGLEKLAISAAFREVLLALIAPAHVDRPKSAGTALKALLRASELDRDLLDTQPLGPTTSVAESLPARRASRRWITVALLPFVLLLVGALASRMTPDFSSPQAVFEVTSPSVVPNSINELALGLDSAYFDFDDGFTGRELWVYRPHADRVYQVADLTPGAGSSEPRRLFAWRGGILFSASTPGTGEELWLCRTDSLDTHECRLVKDIMHGAAGSEPEPVLAWEDRVLFFATTLLEGRELWCTNGRPGQTALVANLAPGANDTPTMGPTMPGSEDAAYFPGYGGTPLLLQLWKYRRATHDIVALAEVADSASALVCIGDSLVFANFEVVTGNELWIHSPDTLGIHLLKDINSEGSSSPGDFFVWRNRVYFRATHMDTGVELWTTDGTAEGTLLVADLDPGSDSGDPSGFVDAGDQLFFRAQSVAQGKELWVTDGTTEGTRVAVDLQPGTASSTPYNLVRQGNCFFFSADDGAHGEELWMLDLENTESAPQLVADLFPGPRGAEPHKLQFWNDEHGIFIAIAPPGVESLFELRREDGAWQVRRIPLPGQLQEGA